MSKLSVKVLKDFYLLKELFDDSRNFFCFSTQNGRRMIVKVEGKKRCIAINHNFRAVSFLNEETFDFYENPFHLIESYFVNGSVEITDILITMDKIEAFQYLQDNK